MKKKSDYIRILLIFTSWLLATACNQPLNNTGNLKTDYIQARQTAHLMDDTTRPACNITIDLAYISQATPTALADSLNSYFISVALGHKYQTTTPKEAVEAYTQKYISDYKNDLEPLLKEDETNNEDPDAIKAWYSYHKNIKTDISTYKGNLLTYKVDYDEYTGGAHGVYMTTYLNFDLNTMMPLRLEDLFVDEYEEALIDLLWFQLMADNEVESRQELEEMGYATTGELLPTENFFFTEQGITFHYNVYDFTPYVMGITQITIPYMLMEHLLNTDCTLLNEIRNTL